VEQIFEILLLKILANFVKIFNLDLVSGTAAFEGRQACVGVFLLPLVVNKDVHETFLSTIFRVYHDKNLWNCMLSKLAHCQMLVKYTR